jgi:hypothetical protein
LEPANLQLIGVSQNAINVCFIVLSHQRGQRINVSNTNKRKALQFSLLPQLTMNWNSESPRLQQRQADDEWFQFSPKVSPLLSPSPALQWGLFRNIPTLQYSCDFGVTFRTVLQLRGVVFALQMLFDAGLISGAGRWGGREKRLLYVVYEGQ